MSVIRISANLRHFILVILSNVFLFQEPVIAEDLARNNYLYKLKCIDFENIKEQYTYRVC